MDDSTLPVFRRRIRVLLGIQAALAAAMLLGSRAATWTLPDVLQPVNQGLCVIGYFYPLIVMLPLIVAFEVTTSSLGLRQKLISLTASLLLGFCGAMCFLPMVTRY